MKMNVRSARSQARTARAEKAGAAATDLAAFILKRNEAQSREFCSPGAALARRLYRAQHPSEILALKCMDGRLNLSVMTNTPPGILKPYRNIGGKFDLGWPFFGRLVLDDVEYAVSKGRPAIILSTYHFSKGDHHRGCAGYSYDTEAARAGAKRLHDQLERAFGGGAGSVVRTIVVGIETDKDTLIFENAKGDRLSVAEYADASEADMHEALRRLYPQMPSHIVNDILPLALGNQRHIRTLRACARPLIDMEHREQIIAVGRGFDWLHLPNRALIVGPYDPNWEHAVATAGSIVLGNMKARRVPEKEGALLLVSAPFRSIGADQGVAEQKVLFLARESERVLRERVPELAGKLRTLAGTVDMHTRRFHVLDTRD